MGIVLQGGSDGCMICCPIVLKRLSWDKQPAEVLYQDRSSRRSGAERGIRLSLYLPFLLHGDGLEEGTAFETTTHGPTTYWIVIDYGTEAKHAQYVRVIPEANTGTVDVFITSNGTGGATVNVAYQLTGLSPAGNAGLEDSFSETNYAEMMEEWRTMINDSRATIDDHFGR